MGSSDHSVALAQKQHQWIGVAHRDLKLENFLLTEGDFEEETVLLKLVSRRNYVYGGFVRGFIGIGICIYVVY